MEKPDMTYVPLFAIGRHRMGTDGRGVRTLIGLHGCELDCRYCINPQSKNGCTEHRKLVTAQYIIDILRKDELYFLATGGGITLGGGEPLLHSRFLAESFFGVYGKKWHVMVETSLNVMPELLHVMLPYIDEYVIDVKDMNPEIYQRYTGKTNGLVVQNLQWLIDQGKEDHITVRLPLIPGYNTEKDREKSRKQLEAMGIKRFDAFTYKTNLKKKPI